MSATVHEGSILVAAPFRPVDADPVFSRSVILVLRIDAEDTIGVIINRPRGNSVYSGGPITIANEEGHHCRLFIHSRQKGPLNARAIGDSGFVYSLYEPDDAFFRHLYQPDAELMIEGCVGWPPGQLEWKHGTGPWRTAHIDLATILKTPPQDRYALAAQAAGFKPPPPENPLVLGL